MSGLTRTNGLESEAAVAIGGSAEASKPKGIVSDDSLMSMGLTAAPVVVSTVGRIERSIDLHCTTGGSDKVYHLAMIEHADGYSVDFAYGRRGNDLVTGTKTAGGNVPYSAAVKIYDKIEKEKRGKDYGDSSRIGSYYGPAVSASASVASGATSKPAVTTTKVAPQVASGFLPQLLNQITEEEAAVYVASKDHVMEEKHDGTRKMVQRNDGVSNGINKKGQFVAMNEAVLAVINSIPAELGNVILDGELVGDTYHVFDVLMVDGNDTRGMNYDMRMKLRSQILSGISDQNVLEVKTARTPEEKAAMLDKLRVDNAEGAVFKRVSAEYKEGRPASGGDQLKLKFYSTLSVVVEAQNAQRSVRMMLTDGKDWQAAGNVTIPPNQEIPEPGEVVEVRYLYAGKSGILFQPTYLGKRDDVDKDECIVSQLKFKRVAVDEEDDA